MARFVEIAAAPSAEGLRDEGAHRSAHAPVYRTYAASDRDPFYQAGDDAEDRQALLRGLFLTAFLADDFFAEHGYFGATRIVVSSASSKTAIGFAQQAAQRGVGEVVGVTAPRNLDFVRRLGCYDRVVTYDAVETIPADAPAVSIDIAGDGAVLERVHRHFGDRLRHSMTVGLSHHDAPRAAEPSCGPRPALFFAPTQVERRLRDWGPDGYRTRVADALRAFVGASRRWLHISRTAGPEAVVATWNAVRDGRVSPDTGHVVSIW